MTTDSQPALQPPELLPCPLCGSTNLFLRDIAGWELDCRDCELSLVLADDPSREGLIARWNTRARVVDGVVATVGQRHWQLRIGAQETMCGRDIKGVSFTLLSEYVTCEICNAAKFGYQMGRADERAAATAPIAAPHDEQNPTLKDHALRLINEIRECPNGMCEHCLLILVDELEPLLQVADMQLPAKDQKSTPTGLRSPR